MEMNRLPWKLGLVLASSVNFAGAFLLAFFWRINLVLYCFIIFVTSCLLGALVIDIRKSIPYVYISMVLGLSIAIVLILAPHPMFTSMTGFDLAAIAVFTVAGKLALVSLIVYFLGAVFGCFLGEKYERRPRI